MFPSACDHPHNGEVIAKATLPAGPYPEASKLAEQAGAVCKEHVPDKVKDVIDADFDPRAGVPGREDWNDGKREVTCTLVYVGKNNTLTTPMAIGDREVTCLLEARKGTLRRSLVPVE